MVVLCVFLWILAPVLTHAQSSPTAQLRAGKHATYNRLVFDNVGNIPYTTQKSGQVLTLVFETPFTLNSGGYSSASYPWIDSLTSSREGTRQVVVITMAKPTKYRHFVNEKSVVVDILKPEAVPKIAKVTPQQAQKEVEKRRVETKDVLKEEGKKPPLQKKSGSTSGESSLTAPIETDIATAEATEQSGASEKTASATPPESILKAAPTSDESTAFFAPLDKAQQYGGELSFSYLSTPNGVRMAFLWDKETRASIFKRFDTIWAVFDRPARLVASPGSKQDEQLIELVRQLPHDLGTVVRIQTIPGVNPEISRDGKSWVLNFKPSGFAPDIAIDPISEPLYGSGPRVFLPVESAGTPLSFIDPVVGDALIAGPLLNLSRGVPQPKYYTDFELLPSIQGVAIAQKSDSTLLRVAKDGYEVSNTRGLKLAPQDTIESADMGVRIFRFKDWKMEEKGRFTEAEQDLFHDLSYASNYQKPGLRAQLARFYFAHGFWNEATGVLKALIKVDKEYLKRPEVPAILGASAFMTGRYDTAYNHLLNPKLDAFPEVALWRAALAAKQGLWETAKEQFGEGGAIPSFWPLAVKQDIAFAAMETALALEEPDQARKILSAFEQSLSASEYKIMSRKKYLKLMSGRINYASGDSTEALKEWKDAAESDDQYVRTRGQLNLILAQIEKNKIPMEEGIERLERLRFAWRSPRVKSKNEQLTILEDNFEFKVLEALGKNYVENGDYRRALTSLRTAIATFDQVRDTSELSRMMTDIFNTLFYEGEANKLPPLKALALFDEFRELAPVDDKGDVMIEKLADRIVALDLLDRAAELLEYQVKFRLKGLEKGRIGTRLALVYILNNEPKKALKMLNETEMPGMSPAVLRQRRLLKARALFETGNPNDAVSLLHNDYDMEADLLRADIYWRTQNWEMAGNVLSRLLDQAQTERRADPDAHSDNQIREMILNLTVSYALAKEEERVNELRRRYARYMMGSSYADIFNLITDSAFSSTSVEGIDTFNELSKRFAKIDMFERFINSYRSQLATDGLSSVN